MIESLLVTAAALTTVFGWAFFSFWSAIPAGLALNVTPLLVLVTVTVSYSSGVALILVVGTPLRQRIRRRMQGNADEAARPNRAVSMVQSAWARYGLIGLALLAPMTVGAQVGAVIGLSFGARPVPLLLAMTLGAALWALALTLAIGAGIVTINSAL